MAPGRGDRAPLRGVGPEGIETHSDESILLIIRDAVANVAEGRIGAITSSTRIEDLPLDSVATLEVLGALEDALCVRFPDDELASLRTIGDLTTLLRRLSRC